MGQHKYNPTAIAAKSGELPPKPPRPGKREREAMLHAEMLQALHKKGLAAPLMMAEAIADAPYRK